MLEGAATLEWEDDEKVARSTEMSTRIPSDEGTNAAGPGDGTTYFENERTIADAKLEGNMGNLVMDHDGRLRLLSAAQMGGDGDGYTWGQGERELFVHVPCAQGTTKTDIELCTTSRSLSLRVCGRLILDGDLYAPILSDESHYTIEEAADGAETVAVSLTKATATKANEHWKSVMQGGSAIDTKEFGAPVVAFDEDRDVSEYLQYMKESNALGYS
eukprot:7295226-Prymnesium_polylepis.1